MNQANISSSRQRGREGGGGIILRARSKLVQLRSERGRGKYLTDHNNVLCTLCIVFFKSA